MDKHELVEWLGLQGFRSLEYKRGYLQAMQNSGVITEDECFSLRTQVREQLGPLTLPQETEPNE